MRMIVDEENALGERLDVFLAECPELCDDFTRSGIQNLISSGNILVNGKQVKSGYKLKMCDLINMT